MGKRKRKKKKLSKAVRIMRTEKFVLAILLGVMISIVIQKEHLIEKYIVPFEEVTIQEAELENKFYYQQIKKEEKTADKEILQGVRNNQEEIYVHCGDPDRTNLLLEFVLNDFPDIFWCSGFANSTVYETEEPFAVLEPVYSYKEAEQENKMAKIEEQAEEFLSSVPEDADDYEKILSVYEYIVDNVEYDEKASDNQNIYSVFVNKKSVCAGYSKAAQYLLEQMGVFCTYITGKATENEAHAWNLVQCEGEYYYVDTTWGDPVFQEDEESLVEMDNISFDYMCCDDDTLFKTHTPDKFVELPKCTSMKNNYYVVNGMYYKEYDREEALEIMKENIDDKENPTVFKFSNSEEYKQAEEDIFDDVVEEAAQYMGNKYRMDEMQYQYFTEPELNKIELYWKYE